jgi:hypothetical protein
VALRTIAMNFLKKKISVSSTIIVSLVSFLLGPGFIWEWRKTDIESARLDIERARASLEIREKMNPMLVQLLKLDIDSPDAIAKVEDFNAAEINLARIEGRKPILYTFQLATPTNLKVAPKMN